MVNDSQIYSVRSLARSSVVVIILISWSRQKDKRNTRFPLLYVFYRLFVPAPDLSTKFLNRQYTLMVLANFYSFPEDARFREIGAKLISLDPGSVTNAMHNFRKGNSLVLEASLLH